MLCDVKAESEPQPIPPLLSVAAGMLSLRSAPAQIDLAGSGSVGLKVLGRYVVIISASHKRTRLEVKFKATKKTWRGTERRGRGSADAEIPLGPIKCFAGVKC